MQINKIISKYAIDNGFKRSDCAYSIGITISEFYGFFKGNKIISIETIRKISKFTGIHENDVRDEYMENLNKYLKDKGL